MESENKRRNRLRVNRKFHVRNQVKGTAVRPRLSYNKSNRYLTVQLIDDVTGNTLVYLSTNSKQFKKDGVSMKSVDAAKSLGVEMAKLAKKQGVEALVVDRGMRKYGGALKVLSSELRDSGLKL